VLPIDGDRQNLTFFPCQFFRNGKRILKVDLNALLHTKLVCKFCGDPLREGSGYILSIKSTVEKDKPFPGGLLMNFTFSLLQLQLCLSQTVADLQIMGPASIQMSGYE